MESAQMLDHTTYSEMENCWTKLKYIILAFNFPGKWQYTPKTNYFGGFFKYKINNITISVILYHSGIIIIHVEFKKRKSHHVCVKDDFNVYEFKKNINELAPGTFSEISTE
jgi:hypothetical protein